MMQGNVDALGYVQLTTLSSAVGLTVPAGSTRVIVQAEAKDVRYRDDGSDPTASVGMLLITNTIYEFTVAQLTRMKFIESSASAKLNASFYGLKT